MDDVRERLARCFGAVFPQLRRDRVYTASQAELPQWDSLAAITLYNLIEEEFGIPLDFETMGELTSFPLILDHLKSRE